MIYSEACYISGSDLKDTDVTQATTYKRFFYVTVQSLRNRISVSQYPNKRTHQNVPSSDNSRNKKMKENFIPR